jgi:hypothetical protein
MEKHNSPTYTMKMATQISFETFPYIRDNTATLPEGCWTLKQESVHSFGNVSNQSERCCKHYDHSIDVPHALYQIEISASVKPGKVRKGYFGEEDCFRRSRIRCQDLLQHQKLGYRAKPKRPYAQIPTYC